MVKVKMPKKIFLFLIFAAAYLNGECISDEDCHQGRTCFRKLCISYEEFSSGSNVEDTFRYFFENIPSGRYKGFFLSKEEYSLFDMELPYNLYLIKMEGEVSAALLAGDEKFVSLSSGKPYILTDLNGEKYTAYKDSAIVYESKTGQYRWKIFSIININGRWAIFKIIDI